jgi:outer membrane protein OmpA-like peptidoglycan-associated protein
MVSCASSCAAQATVLVHGHTDVIGGEDHNRDLSLGANDEKYN